MFWKNNHGTRCLVLTYDHSMRGQEIFIRFTFAVGSTVETEDVRFESEKARDTYLKLLDDGRGPALIDRGKIPGRG
jgi:hypothetical protein